MAIPKKFITKQDRNGRILDIGCGPNPRFLDSIQFAEKYGIDKDIDETTKDKYKYKINLYSLDVTKLNEADFEANSFNVVTMLALVEHLQVPELVTLFKQIKRILKPGGKLVITMPSKKSKPVLNLLAKFRLVSRVEIADHKYYFDASEFQKFLKNIYANSIIISGTFEFKLNNYFVVGIRH